MKTFHCFLILLIIMLPSAVIAQPEAGGDRLEIVSSDTMRHSKTHRGILIELIGNVHFRQGTAEMFCGRAEYWKDANETIIEENVRVYDRNKTLIADKIFYYNIPQVFKAMGHVFLKDSLRKITAKQISYFKLEDRVIAEKDVVLNDSLNYIDILGERAEFNNRTDYVLITGAPIFIKKDSTGKEELRITSIKMELFEGGDKALVSDSVRITQSKASATCGLAEFYRKQNEIFLKQLPVVWQEDDKLTGELIQLFITKNNLTKVIVENQAKVVSKVDTTEVDQRLNILTGEKITMHFRDEALDHVVVENKATSVYHIFEDHEDKGSNKIIGDKISVFLTDRKIERIVVESNPQLSSGSYYPPGKLSE
ncbi:MAG TPA: OstA-like protein [bacterium]